MTTTKKPWFKIKKQNTENDKQSEKTRLWTHTHTHLMPINQVLFWSAVWLLWLPFLCYFLLVCFSASLPFAIVFVVDKCNSNSNRCGSLLCTILVFCREWMWRWRWSRDNKQTHRQNIYRNVFLQLCLS